MHRWTTIISGSAFRTIRYSTRIPTAAATTALPHGLDRPNQTASLNYIWTVAPNKVNEFLGYGQRRSRDNQRDTGSLSTKQLRDQLSVYLPAKGNLLTRSRQLKLPISEPLTVDPIRLSQRDRSTISQILSRGSKAATRSSLAASGSIPGQNDFDQINVSGVPGGTNNQNGRFVFNDSRPGGSGLAIANAALGLYTTYAELGTRAYTPYRGSMFEFFAQDGWKVNAKLHLDYGVRYSIIQPYKSLWGNMSVFDIASYDPAKRVVQDPVTGYSLATPGTSTTVWSFRATDSRRRALEDVRLPPIRSSIGCSSMEAATPRRTTTTFSPGSGSHTRFLRKPSSAQASGAISHESV